MLSVTDAVKSASLYLQNLIPEAQNMRLEEVELSDDDRFWNVTLSFIDPKDESQAPLQAITAGRPRKYKIIRLDRNSGEVRWMKIREREHV